MRSAIDDIVQCAPCLSKRWAIVIQVMILEPIVEPPRNAATITAGLSLAICNPDIPVDLPPIVSQSYAGVIVESGVHGAGAKAPLTIAAREKLRFCNGWTDGAVGGSIVHDR